MYSHPTFHNKTFYDFLSCKIFKQEDTTLLWVEWNSFPITNLSLMWLIDEGCNLDISLMWLVDEGCNLDISG
jgi:hypothetical protein